MRIRTIKQALEEIRAEDRETPLTAFCIRRWIQCGALPAIKSGNKYLISMETLNDFLKGQNLK